MDIENETNSNKIQESFLSIIKEFKESYSGLFIKGVTDPEIIKEGDLKEIGTSLTRISEFLYNRLDDLELPPPEEKIDKIKSRLEEAVKAIHQMGIEIESMKSKEPEDYHWYVVGTLAMVLVGLFDYIEIYLDTINP